MLAALAAISCGEPRAGSSIVPERLIVSALPGGNGVLDVVALTLRQGREYPEVYAALKNDSDTPACDAALAIELFDGAQQSLAAGISGVLARRFYRRTDGSGAIASCVSPGDVAMAAVTDFSGDFAIADVSSIVYHCPYFALDVEPIAGLELRGVERVSRDGGTAYTGTFINSFDLTVSRPAVSVFPVDEIGRPLGLASASGSADVEPGGSWQFETDASDESGADGVAYPTGALETRRE